MSKFSKYPKWWQRPKFLFIPSVLLTTQVVTIRIDSKKICQVTEQVGPIFSELCVSSNLKNVHWWHSDNLRSGRELSRGRGGSMKKNMWNFENFLFISSFHPWNPFGSFDSSLTLFVCLFVLCLLYTTPYHFPKKFTQIKEDDVQNAQHTATGKFSSVSRWVIFNFDKFLWNQNSEVIFLYS